jgi:copper chaperone CopZ
MQTKTVSIPAIHCGHCVMTVQNEVSQIPGVMRVKASLENKNAVIEWDDPANWEQIKGVLVEIDYPPVEN